MNFIRLWQFRTRKLTCCVHNIFYENNLHCHPLLNIGAGVVSPIDHQN
jgi:hypothetical protein